MVNGTKREITQEGNRGSWVKARVHDVDCGQIGMVQHEDPPCGGGVARVAPRWRRQRSEGSSTSMGTEVASCLLGKPKDDQGGQKSRN